MGLFKSKQEKDIEKRLLIKKTIANMNKYINQLEEQKKKYIESAKKAKQIGSETQYNLSVSGLKTAVAQQKRAQEMLLNFELTSQMKDLTAMTGSFLDGMSVLSRDMAKITSNNDFIKVQKEFEKAMLGVEDTSEKLDLFLDASDSSFENLASSAKGVSDDEIASLVDNQASLEEDDQDAEIDRQLEELSKSIMKDN